MLSMDRAQSRLDLIRPFARLLMSSGYLQLKRNTCTDHLYDLRRHGRQHRHPFTTYRRHMIGAHLIQTNITNTLHNGNTT